MVEMNNIPDWEEKYSTEDVESMPWFYPRLDPDFEKILDKLELTFGNALDIGSGSGTQAIALAERGFEVTATDISCAAIEKARFKTCKNSHLELDMIGPFCFRPDEIEYCFDSKFEVLSIRNTVYYGTPDPLPKALICLLKKI